MQRPLMNWNKGQKRWEAMYEKKRFWITARQLAKLHGCPATEAGSVDHANDYYRAMVDSMKTVNPHQPRLDELAKRKQYATANGIDSAKIDAEAKYIERTGDRPLIRGEGPTIQIFNEPTEEAVWTDRLDRLQLTPAERTVKALAKEFLATKIEKQKNGTRSSHAVDSMRRRLEVFVQWAGESTAIEAITGTTWAAWHGWLEAKVAREEFETSTAQAYIVASKGLLAWCYTDREILDALPRNIDKFKFEQSAKKRDFFTAAEVSGFINAATGQLKLHLLLMANTGMTQGDIADLKKSEISPDFATITRKRGKTKRHKDVPTVTWSLWKETSELLRQHLSDHPTLALVTSHGTPWVWEKTDPQTGKITKTDSINTIFRNMLKRTGMTAKAGLRDIRSASSNLLESHATHVTVKEYFLGHSSRSTSGKHYGDDFTKRLSDAIAWLRTQYEI